MRKITTIIFRELLVMLLMSMLKREEGWAEMAPRTQALYQ